MIYVAHPPQHDIRRHDLRHELVSRLRHRLAQEVGGLGALAHQLVVGCADAAGGEDLSVTLRQTIRRIPRSP